MTLNILPFTILMSHTERSIVSRRIVAGRFGPVETQDFASLQTAAAPGQRRNAKGGIMAVQTCHNCVYSFCDPEVWLRNAWMGEPLLVQCANHPWWPGRMREVPGVPCRNYRPKPKLPGGDAVRLIPLGDGFYAYVDAADYDWLSRWTWHHYNGGYVGRHEKGKATLMHNLIMSPPKGMLVDHIDGSRNNNCRFNLRICTRQENQRNGASNTARSPNSKASVTTRERRNGMPSAGSEADVRVWASSLRRLTRPERTTWGQSDGSASSPG